MAATQTRPAGTETRQAILEAALDLFAERSFDGASTRVIAEHAGVTQPLLNYHFAGKEELWRAAVDDLFDRVRTSIQSRLRGLRGVDETTIATLMVRHFVELSASNPQLHRIIMQESKRPGPRLDWLVDTHVPTALHERGRDVRAACARGRAGTRRTRPPLITCSPGPAPRCS